MPRTLPAAAPEPTQYQCRHIRPNGVRCGSPALRDGNFCFYHDRARRCGPRQPQAATSATARKTATFDLPSPADLADRAGVQLAVALLLGKIAANEIDPRRAGLLLYGLQIAASTLPKDLRPGKTPDKQEEPVGEITHDPLHGPLAPATALDTEATSGGNPYKEFFSQVTANMERMERAEAALAAATQAALAAGVPVHIDPHDPRNVTLPDLHAQATPPAPKPNRACRRGGGKHHRPHPKTTSCPASPTGTAPHRTS